MRQILVSVGLLAVEINAIPHILLSSYETQEPVSEQPANSREGSPKREKDISGSPQQKLIVCSQEDQCQCSVWCVAFYVVFQEPSLLASYGFTLFSILKESRRRVEDCPLACLGAMMEVAHIISALISLAGFDHMAILN